MKRMAIFDLDGTILNTLDDLTGAMNHALKLHDFPLKTSQEIEGYLGNGNHVLVVKACPIGTSDSVIAECEKQFHAYYKEHCYDLTKPYPGIEECLYSLKNKGMIIGVVSNKADYAVKILVEKFFPGLFDKTVGDQEGYKRKPAIDLVEKVANDCGCQLNDVYYIGDPSVDVQTAKNGQMDMIAVLWGYQRKSQLEKSGATTFANTPEELKELLLNS